MLDVFISDDCEIRKEDSKCQKRNYCAGKFVFAMNQFSRLAVEQIVEVLITCWGYWTWATIKGSLSTKNMETLIALGALPAGGADSLGMSSLRVILGWVYYHIQFNFILWSFTWFLLGYLLLIAQICCFDIRYPIRWLQRWIILLNTCSTSNFPGNFASLCDFSYDSFNF